MTGRKRGSNHDPDQEKRCAVCGRRIEWRKKWARHWDEVLYCSDRCRKNKLSPTDHRLEETIIDLLSKRARGATICPSEAARAVGGNSWRTLMEPTRMAARRLAADQRIEVTQRGVAVDPSTARGPIRLRGTTRLAIDGDAAGDG